MDDPKKSVALAHEFLTSVIEDAIDIRVEEIAMPEDGWGRFVTLSYLVEADTPAEPFS